MFVVVFAVLLLIISIAALPFVGIELISSSPSPVAGGNFSGTINVSASVISNASISDVYFEFRLYRNGSGATAGAANNSAMANLSTSNTSAIGLAAGTVNDTYFNTTLDTTTLPDGVYNVTIILYNATAAGDNASIGGVGQAVNKSIQTNYSINVGIDNTAPLVVFSTAATDATSGENFTLSSLNQTFNVSIKDININTVVAGVAPGLVVFEFDNASGNNFNISGVGIGLPGNQSGYWSMSLNVSALHAGAHTVAANVNDTAGNANRTVTLTFNVNTPHNVTWFEDATTLIAGQNFSARNTTVYLNISVINSTHLAPLTGVIFMFSNASGKDFNISNGSLQVFANIPGAQFFNASYNMSALAEGSHTITVFANDTLGNVNKTESISFIVDKTAPSVTVTCTDSPAAAATVTCTCIASDSGAGIRVAAKFQGDTDASESTTAGSSGSSGTSSTCTASDYVGNVGSATGSWSVSSTSTGGSGSGGSSGGTGTSVAGQSAKKTWSSVNAGETASLDVANGAIGVTKISFTVKDIIYGAWVSVSKKDTLPSSVAAFSGKTYRNLQISKSSTVKDEVIENPIINFKVTNAWLSEQGLTKGDVAMHRFADGKWTQLATSLGADDGTYTHYTATTPGFSYFVIGEKEAAAAPTVEGAPADLPAGETGEAGETAPAGEAGEAMVDKEGSSLAMIWIIVAVLLIGGLLWWFLRKK